MDALSHPLSPAFKAAYKDLSARYGACPVEAGLIGNLADHECRHERLPGDASPPCGCWPQEPAPAPPTPKEIMKKIPKPKVDVPPQADLIGRVVTEIEMEIKRLEAARDALMPLA